MRTVHLFRPNVPTDGEEIFDSVPRAKQRLMKHLQARGISPTSAEAREALMELDRWPTDVGGRVQFQVVIMTRE